MVQILACPLRTGRCQLDASKKESLALRANESASDYLEWPFTWVIQAGLALGLISKLNLCLHSF